MSSLAFDGLLRKSSARDERTVGRDVEPAVGLRVRSAHTIIQSLSWSTVNIARSNILPAGWLNSVSCLLCVDLLTHNAHHAHPYTHPAPHVQHTESHRGMPRITGHATKQAAEVAQLCRWKLMRPRRRAMCVVFTENFPFWHYVVVCTNTLFSPCVCVSVCLCMHVFVSVIGYTCIKIDV